MTELVQQQLFEFVLKAQQGDIGAFTQLVAKTQNLVTSTALAIVQDIQASEDVAQNTFVAVWQQIKELKSPDSFLPWLRQITRNKAKNYLRDNKVARQELRSDFNDDELKDESLPTDLQQLETAQINRVVMNIVSELAPEQRDILILYYREQQNSRQVAQLLDLSEANVRQKLSRIRALVKKELLETIGEQLLATVPTAGFTALITSSITTSLPAAASIAPGSASQSSGLFKLLALGGGALLGGLTAIAAIFFAAWLTQRKLSDEQQKLLLRNHARGQASWVLLCSLLFVAAYAFSHGWLAPVLVYSVLIVGLTLQQCALMKLIKTGVIQSESRQFVAGWIGLLLGAGVGFGAMILGLINSGRLVM